jgi:hypothetical protein
VGRTDEFHLGSLPTYFFFSFLPGPALGTDGFHPRRWRWESVRFGERLGSGWVPSAVSGGGGGGRSHVTVMGDCFVSPSAGTGIPLSKQVWQEVIYVGNGRERLGAL